ncbi:phosphoglycerate mutase-like protein [Ascodesmis nigricans]|uniref:3-phytase n=1 Tax=Ascodesmis nigricans TaxID=341454 RepID=A0A4S2N1K1_9PEZI|nr:phosphoglycerate mutase-like protein [Ascodesmis nigricans]
MAPPSARRCSRLCLRLVLILLVLSTMLVLLSTVVFLLNPSSALSWALGSPQQVLAPAPDPGAYGGTSDCHCDDKGRQGQWNILYHLGGNSPWIQKIDDVVEGGFDPPKGCAVDMIHMMSRHGERYPTVNAGARMIKLLERVKAAGTPLKGSLEFLNEWKYFSETPGDHFEQLTTTGPYSGILQAFSTGVKLSTRYRHLMNFNDSAPPTYLWAGDVTRVVDTARYFSTGFFGLNSKHAKVIPVSEAADLGGNTLTPGETCLNNNLDIIKGHDNGYTQLYKFQSSYLPTISQRLLLENPTLEFTPSEIYSMQELCGFETLVRGSSPWCSVFTPAEWDSFEYARDVIHYYRSGPGNPYSRAMGWLWLNATTNLLVEGPMRAGPMYFSFVHDGDIVPLLSALGLFNDAHDLPVTHVEARRKWKTSQVTPMGGRIILERMTCGDDEQYVRINVNDGIVALDGCDSGPGKSCPLERFKEYVEKSGKEAGDFREVCGLGKDAEEGIRFLRQPGYGGYEQ